MKKIEIIRVRSTPDTIAEVLPSLTDHIEGLAGGSGDFDMRIMQHRNYLGDLAIFIVWISDGNPGKSREGVLVAEILQEIGALNHVVWLTSRA